MKKVSLFAAAALVSASVLVSCGGAKDAEKALADSLAKAGLEAVQQKTEEVTNAGVDSLNKAVENTQKAVENATETGKTEQK